jgi:hypothetical protein
VPDALQEPLLGAVNALSAQAPICLPKVTAAEPSPPPPPPRPAPAHHGKAEGEDYHHHGKSKGHDR